VGAVGIGNIFISLIIASNMGAAKSIAPCEATEPGKYMLLINTYFNYINIEMEF